MTIRRIIAALRSDTRCYEYSSGRVILFAGNISRYMEHENRQREGWELSIEFVGPQHVGQFDVGPMWEPMVKIGEPRRVLAKRHDYLSRGFSMIIGHYGITIDVRGREITGTDWDIPRWQLNNPEYQ